MALTTNLVAYYKLDESSGNPVDSSGNGYTLTNANTTYSTGLINNGAYGGATNYTTSLLSRADALGQSLSGAFSISLWIKMRQAIGAAQLFHVFNWRGSSDLAILKYFGANFFDSTPSLGLSLGTADPLFHYDYTIPTASFTHIAITVPASGTVTMYVNGSSVATGTRTTQSGGGAMTSLFQATDQGSSGGACIYDEVGFWSRALSSTEITALYNGGAGLTYPFTTVNSGAFFLLFN